MRALLYNALRLKSSTTDARCHKFLTNSGSRTPSELLTTTQARQPFGRPFTEPSLRVAPSFFFWVVQRAKHLVQQVGAAWRLPTPLFCLGNTSTLAAVPGGAAPICYLLCGNVQPCASNVLLKTGRLPSKAGTRSICLLAGHHSHHINIVLHHIACIGDLNSLWSHTTLFGTVGVCSILSYVVYYGSTRNRMLSAY